MFLGHMDSMQRLRSSKELLLSDPVSELDGDEDDDEVVSAQILYTASFEEFASSILTYDTIIWVSISLLLVLAWGVGVIMLLYLPMKRYVLSKDLCSRQLYVTPSEVVYKVSRPSFIPFCGVVKLERRIPLALVIDIIIEQGCLQAMFGIHTFRLESVAQRKASYVDELQIQGVSNPELLRKVIVKEASKAIQDSGRTWKASVYGTAPENPTQIRSFTDGSVFRSPRNGKAMNSPRPVLAEPKVLSCTEVLLHKMDEVSQSVKRLERIVENAHHSQPSPTSSPETTTTTTATTAAITTSTAALSLDNQPLITFTENSSATYSTSQNPCLDFFFHVVPDTSPEDLINRLDQSWKHNPLTTLKLICNLRSVRGSGKSDKRSFYTSAIWLHNNHPKTLGSNIPVLVEFGYFKDLLEILYRLIEGPEVRKVAKSEWISKKSAKGKGITRKTYFLSKKKKKNAEDDEMKAKLRVRVPREQRIEENRAQMKAEKERAKLLKKEKESAMAEKARDRYASDPDYRLLHDQVSMFFANRLRSDIESLNSGDYMKISLAAKWCPSVESSYDKALLICESIARILYPRDSDPEFGELDDVSYAFRAKNLLRKQVLVPLRNALKLPEVYMSAKQWSSIAYDRVASIAMKNYTDIFLHRDNERFRSYLENVKTGDAKIAAGALLPHEIIGGLSRGSGAAIVAELQWKRMVDDLLKKGKLTNCIAVCDVSGSMSGTPMEVSVALGLLVSELSAEPWKGHVITFSESPELHLIKGRDLRSKTEFIRNMDWGMNTNFQQVFDRLLEVGVNGKLSEDDMVKRVFVFSDMEFDQASSDPWETDHEAIERKFRERGYARVPEIVFWNLRDSSSTPVTASQKGVALLSGFSKNLLTLFLEEGGVVKPEDIQPKMTGDGNGDLNPEDTMEAAISGELYQKLVVID